MEPKTSELIRVLSQIAALLQSDGENHWRAWMLKAKASLEGSDYSGIEYLLSAYGGMGSFNDLILGQTMENSAFAWKQGYVELNEKLDALRGEAWQLAQAIKRNHEIQDM